MISVIEERVEIIPTTTERRRSEFFILVRDPWGSQLQAPWPALGGRGRESVCLEMNRRMGTEGAVITPGVSPALRDIDVMFFRALGFLFVCFI